MLNIGDKILGFEIDGISRADHRGQPAFRYDLVDGSASVGRLVLLMTSNVMAINVHDSDPAVPELHRDKTLDGWTAPPLSDSRVHRQVASRMLGKKLTFIDAEVWLNGVWAGDYSVSRESVSNSIVITDHEALKAYMFSDDAAVFTRTL